MTWPTNSISDVRLLKGSRNMMFYVM